jgi:hypothetical protein
MTKVEKYLIVKLVVANYRLAYLNYGALYNYHAKTIFGKSSEMLKSQLGSEARLVFSTVDWREITIRAREQLGIVI